MAISLDCLAAALDPFTPHVTDPLDSVGTVGKINDWLNPARLLAKAAASNFNRGSAAWDTIPNPAPSSGPSIYTRPD